MPPLTVAPKIVRNLRLTGAALTENPSQDGAKILLIRKKEAPLAEEVTLQNQLAALQAENIERAKRETALEAKLAASEALQVELNRKEVERSARELQRAKDDSRAECISIARSVAPTLKAQGVETGDVLYRIREAAIVTGDKTLETDLLALLRASEARAVAANLITRSHGSGPTEDVDMLAELPQEFQRAVAPFMKAAEGNLKRAKDLAIADASKRGDDPTYILLRDTRVTQ